MPISPLRIFLTVALVLVASTAFAQQSYVARYDAYAGYAFLNHPSVNLFANGFAAQVGFRPKTWYSFGFDYSLTKGNLSLTPDLLPTALQQQLGAQLGQMIGAGLLPKTYTLAVPAHATTQTFAVGPQLAYRHFTHATLFLRPLFAGAIHESATPQPNPSDLFAVGVVQKLAPSGKKTDITWFVGVGGGFDIIMSKHVSWRVQSDFVYNHLFNDLLQNGYWVTRFSVGPAFNFGRNIKE